MPFEPLYEFLVPYIATRRQGKSLSTIPPQQGAQVGVRCGCGDYSFPISEIEENRANLPPRCHDDYKNKKNKRVLKWFVNRHGRPFPDYPFLTDEFLILQPWVNPTHGVPLHPSERTEILASVFQINQHKFSVEVQTFKAVGAGLSHLGTTWTKEEAFNLAEEFLNRDYSEYEIVR